MKKRLDVHIDEERYDYIKEMSEKSGIPMSVISDELLTIGIAVKSGELVEQQSLPIIRDIVKVELRQQLAEQRSTLREEIIFAFTDELREVTRKSDNRLAALIMRPTRDSNVVRRLLWTTLAKAYGPEFAQRAYLDAREKAGQELANRPAREKTEDEQ
jgi:hypothetical protein